jgi:signal peptidase I
MPDPAHALAALLLEDATRFDRAAKSLAQQTIEFPIVGHSMEPTVAHGATVRVDLGASVRSGDVVLFRQDHQLVAHRVIHRGARAFLTRGDGRTAPDPPVAFDSVLGVVSSPLPPMRRHWLQRFVLDVPFTLMMLLALPLGAGAFCARLLRFIERRVLLRIMGRA